MYVHVYNYTDMYIFVLFFTVQWQLTQNAVTYYSVCVCVCECVSVCVCVSVSVCVCEREREREREREWLGGGREGGREGGRPTCIREMYNSN